MSKVMNLTAADFEKEVLKSDVPALVDFWAEWCGPCRMMAPVLEELSEDMVGKLKVVKVDVEDPANLALAQQYQIRSIPNMKLFRGGQVVKDIVGVRPKAALLAEIGEL
jgi:thioredoxin 1